MTKCSAVRWRVECCGVRCFPATNAMSAILLFSSAWLLWSNRKFWLSSINIWSSPSLPPSLSISHSLYLTLFTSKHTQPTCVRTAEDTRTPTVRFFSAARLLRYCILILYKIGVAFDCFSSRYITSRHTHICSNCQSWAPSLFHRTLCVILCMDDLLSTLSACDRDTFISIWLMSRPVINLLPFYSRAHH